MKQQRCWFQKRTMEDLSSMPMSLRAIEAQPVAIGMAPKVQRALWSYYTEQQALARMGETNAGAHSARMVKNARNGVDREVYVARMAAGLPVNLTETYCD